MPNVTFATRLSAMLQSQRVRYDRVRSMTMSEILGKFRKKLSRSFGYRYVVRRVAYHLNAHSIQLFSDSYAERPERGPQNLGLKLERQRQGGTFEPHSIALLNKSAVQLLEPEEIVLEGGCGTGMFSNFAAEDESRILTASEQDAETLKWVKQNRSRSNIMYCDRPLSSFDTDEFDVVAAIELIEHVFDYPGFLKELSRVAPRAIITTPNKNRSPMDSIANTPAYDGHVREWTAGEFYWILRAFYSDVSLYTIPDFSKKVERYRDDRDFTTPITECSVLTQSEPLIAACRNPVRAWLNRDH
jgi:2-polyprenyl-3-methyl-5-hydroxy-6-metoxy-1,4-benzoquinol methylase